MDQDFAEFRQHVRGRADRIRELIVAHSRRAHILEMQHAVRGNTTDPAIIIELQDIRTELERLRKELSEAEIKSDYLLNRTDDGSKTT